MSLTLTRGGINRIFGWEVGSPTLYRRLYARPTWPGGASGVTIGGGYDLGYNTQEQIQADWHGLVSEKELAFLLSCAGIKGAAAKSKAVNGQWIEITLEAAIAVFEKKSIPRFARLAERAFKGLDQLLPDVQTMIVSICFNRGTALQDTNQKKQNRLEMRKLAAAIPIKDYKAIADSIRSMKRLWDGVPDYPGDIEQKVTGLLIRREEEAQVVDKSNRQYESGELIQV